MPPVLRHGSVFVRALHLAPASVILGGFWFGVPHSELHLFYMLAGLSGLVLMAIEMMGHPGYFRQGVGVATVVKLSLLVLVPFSGNLGFILMLVTYCIAVIGAHMTKRWRHRILF